MRTGNRVAHGTGAGLLSWLLVVAAHSQVSEQALQIHKRALVFDAHIHAVEREFYHGGSIGDRQTNGQFDVPRALEGGLGAMFFSIYVAEDYYPARLETKQALRLIDCALTQLAKNREHLELALNASDVERIHRTGKIAAVLDLEGSYDLDGDLGVLRMLHRLGLRSAQLSAHNRPNHYADACCSPAQWHGLTAHGRELIHEMNRLGMVINVSHASDDAISQAIDASSDPVMATHHGMRSLNDIPRNMPDWLMKKLAAKDGVIGFQIGNEFHNPKEFAYRAEHSGGAFWKESPRLEREAHMSIEQIDQLIAPQFPMDAFKVPDDLRFTVDDWVGVVDRAIQLVGEDHVALGSDFDGGPTPPRNLRDVRDLPMITAAMVRRGYSEERIDKFLGRNVLDLFRRVTEKKKHSN
jgi:membrane dipeptidase